MWIVFFVSVCKPSAIASLITGRHQLVWSDWTFYICKGSTIKLYDRTMKYNRMTSWKLLTFRSAVAKNGKVAHKPQVNEWPTRQTMLNSSVCLLKRPAHVKLMLANSNWCVWTTQHRLANCWRQQSANVLLCRLHTPILSLPTRVGQH